MEERDNKGRFVKGMTPHNKGRGEFKLCQVCLKEMWVENNLLKSKKFCSKKCCYKGRNNNGLFVKGHKDFVPKESRGHTEETKEKMKKTSRENLKRGSDSPNWRGGKGTERHNLMKQFEYREWRKKVFTRDNYTCQICNKQGGYLEADHIKEWCNYPELRYDLDNGRTLCKPCHKKIDNYGVKALKKKVG